MWWFRSTKPWSMMFNADILWCLRILVISNEVVAEEQVREAS